MNALDLLAREAARARRQSIATAVVAPLAIGLTITMDILMGGPLTGRR